jgi:N6-L-threonylcarbamoyladenine synthase
MKILALETSCDETAAAVYDSDAQCMLSSVLYSQTKHEKFGGVVPEFASRSHVEKINDITAQALDSAMLSLKNIDAIAVTTKPGLVGSLLVGLCFAKGMAWALKKPLIGVDHLEGHIFSSFLTHDKTQLESHPSFPYLCLSVSGGHTALYMVHDFGKFEVLGQTLDDAAGEAFDKIARMIGYPYPGGPHIERLAAQANFQDFFSYPRSRAKASDLNFSFSGLKTAVLYDTVSRGAFDIKLGIIPEKMTDELKVKIASSLQVCISDIFVAFCKRAFSLYPQAHGLTFVGGVACNKYITQKLGQLCQEEGKAFKGVARAYATDNAAMIAFVASYRAATAQERDLTLDVLD